jgi:hypothetical protein
MSTTEMPTAAKVETRVRSFMVAVPHQAYAAWHIYPGKSRVRLEGRECPHGWYLVTKHYRSDGDSTVINAKALGVSKPREYPRVYISCIEEIKTDYEAAFSVPLWAAVSAAIPGLAGFVGRMATDPGTAWMMLADRIEDNSGNDRPTGYDGLDEFPAEVVAAAIRSQVAGGNTGGRITWHDSPLIRPTQWFYPAA